MEKEIYYEIYEEDNEALLNSFSHIDEALLWAQKKSNLCSKKFFIKEVVITTSTEFVIQLGKLIQR